MPLLSSADLTFDRRHIWHPYTSMTHPLPCYPIVAATGVELCLDNGQRLIDGMSSWWAAIHGYNHPRLNQAIQNQLEQMAHVMFGGITHPAAIRLSQQLVAITPAALECVFLADSGSVAVEVALKMAIQYWQAKGQSRQRFLALKWGYHGDTLGAMSVCDPDNSMHRLYQHYITPHLFVEPWTTATNEDLQLAALFSANATQLAGVILEPIVQGAGGMRIYPAAFLQRIHALCQQYQIPLIADEIATGFGRTGKLFACEHAGIVPDILCLGKALSGGYLNLAATLTTRQVADTISQGEAGCFMHGPTFMANPLACAVAAENLAMLGENKWQAQVAAIEQQLKTELLALAQHPDVADVRVLGAIGAVEMRYPVNMANLQRFFVEQGVWIRPFGRLIYLMPPYIIKPQQLSRLTAAISLALEQGNLLQIN